MLAAAPAQSLTFSTLAGEAGQRSADGAANNARFNAPGSVAVDGAGNAYVCDSASHTIRKISPAGMVSTLAGLAGVSGSADGAGGSARFNQPQGIAVDSGGTVCVADTGNHTLRLITSAGVVSTLAGLAGSSGSADGTGSSARFYSPQGAAVDSSGNVYVADTWNHTIRKITPAGVVSTLAGSAGTYGSADGTGAGAQFYQPQGIAVDSAGNVYVADTANQAIRKITAGGAVSTLAGLAGAYGAIDGTGGNARFYGPAGVAVDSAGNVYVADGFNSTIRKITSAGAVSTLAGLAGHYGHADLIGGSARFWEPQGLAVDAGGSLWVADTGNGTIRKVSPSGAVSTRAGSASVGSTDLAGNRARFFRPGGVAADGAGNLFVADTENHLVRKVTVTGEASTLAGAAGQPGSTDGTGSNARFFGPQGIAADGSGNVFVADSANHTIRKITSAGVVSTLAGQPGTNGIADGAGANAQFYQPQALAADTAGNVYVADTWNHTIRKLSAAGAVTTLAGLAGNFGSADGTNANARFNWPAGIAVDSAGNVFVSDYFNHTIRMVTPGGVSSTIAGLAGVWGNADGTNSSARFFGPQGIVAGAGGVLYVADTGNQTLRKLTLAGTNWAVTTVGGLTGSAGSADGLGSVAQFCFPAGLALGSAGSLYLADRGNNTLRLGMLSLNGAPAIVSQPQGLSADPGSTVTFNVVATGANPLSYQWRVNGTNIAGANAGSYMLESVQTVDAGYYSVVITNPAGTVASANAQLSLNGPPQIVGQPAAQTVFLGQNVALNTVVVGTEPLSFQWRCNGQAIPGATDQLLAFSPVRGTDAGVYSVLVTNAFGQALSLEARLVVVAAQSWGDASSGQANVPTAAAGAIAVAAGAWHNLALQADGTVVAWGENAQGQCNVPASLHDALAIAAGAYHSLAIRADGTVVAWGDNTSNQTNVPFGLRSVVAISGGKWHSLALRADGTVVAWGQNGWGQCNVPAGLTEVVAIAAGGNHSLALKSDGTVAAWGENLDAAGHYAGQSVVPFGLVNVAGVAAGDYHSVVFLTNGRVLAWGDNSQEQCSVPAGLGNVVAMACGAMHTLALKADGSLVAWGANWNGQCATPSVMTDVVALSAGEEHSLALARSALPAPQLWQPAWRNGCFKAWAQSLNRTNYILEYKSALGSATWISVSTNAGNGALKLLADPAATAQQRFYRMRAP